MALLAALDILLRGGAVAILALTAAVFATGGRGGAKSLPLVPLSAGLAAYVVLSSPNLAFDHGPLRIALTAAATAVPVLIYWAGMAFFIERFRLVPAHGAVAAVLIGAAWIAPLVPVAGLVRAILAALLYLHLFYVALRTAEDDLVEGRRRFRRWFLAIVAALCTAIALAELFRLDESLPAVLFPIHAAAIAGLAAAFLLWAVERRRDIWPQGSATPQPAPDTLSTADRAVLVRLETAMAAGVWREENLTIARLSARVGSQEHRLRRVINQGLGHRNFSAFINGPRLRAAQDILADPSRADLPILTIAYDVGFGSVGAFNRAFRDATGTTPTEFRRAQLRQPAQS